MRLKMLAAAAAFGLLAVASTAKADPVSVTYYSNWTENTSTGLTFSNPFFSETLPSIDFNFPAAGCVANSRPNASCAWAGNFTGDLGVSSTGSYNLSLTSDDGSYLFIDGVLVDSVPGTHGAETNTVSVNLTGGLHAFDVQYYNSECCAAVVDLSLAEGVVFSAPPTTGVPEPATWAMLLVGVGATGAMLRHRRSILAPA